MKDDIGKIAQKTVGLAPLLHSCTFYFGFEAPKMSEMFTDESVFGGYVTANGVGRGTPRSGLLLRMGWGRTRPTPRSSLPGHQPLRPKLWQTTHTSIQGKTILLHSPPTACPGLANAFKAPGASKKNGESPCGLWGHRRRHTGKLHAPVESECCPQDTLGGGPQGPGSGKRLPATGDL